jgi:hypothetical protein
VGKCLEGISASNNHICAKKNDLFNLFLHRPVDFWDLCKTSRKGARERSKISKSYIQLCKKLQKNTMQIALITS